MEGPIIDPVEVHPNTASCPLTPILHTDKKALTSRFTKIINTIEMNGITDTDVLINEIYPVTLDQNLSLLIEASINGEKCIVKSLIDRFNVAVDNLGDVIHENSLVIGVTALWCAAANGNIEVVQILVEYGANVNFIIKPISPFQENISINNICNSTCLMIACYNEQINVADYLLENGADVDIQNNCGDTAMHFVAETINVSLAELLLQKNPLLLKNELALTPVLVAAEKSNFPMTKYMLDELDLSREEKIEAEELLGASFLNYDYNMGYTIIFSALQKRLQEPELRKKVVKPVEFYNNKVEFQDLQELEMMFGDAEALSLEGLIMRERILGENHPNLIHTILYLGQNFRMVENFKPCLLLWIHALKIASHNKLKINDHLLRLIKVVRDMFDQGDVFDLSDLKNILKSACDELVRFKRRFPDNADKTYIRKSLYFDTTMSCTVKLIYMTSIVLSEKLHREDPEEVPEIMKIIVKIIKNDFRTIDDQTLLHLSLSYQSKMTGTEYWFPEWYCVKLLIFCGADVNAIDIDKNTPLHYIGRLITYFPEIQDDINESDIKKIVMKLLDAGAHTDYVNTLGDCPHTGYLSKLMKLTHTKTRSLKCLSASVLKKQFQEEYYCDKMPTTLLKFLNSH